MRSQQARLLQEQEVLVFTEAADEGCKRATAEAHQGFV